MSVSRSSNATLPAWKVTFDLSEGWVEAEGKKHTIHPLSPRMQAILSAGGLVEYWRNQR
jgi:hypothetical protein